MDPVCFPRGMGAPGDHGGASRVGGAIECDWLVGRGGVYIVAAFRGAERASIFSTAVTGDKKSQLLRVGGLEMASRETTRWGSTRA